MQLGDVGQCALDHDRAVRALPRSNRASPVCRQPVKTVPPQLHLGIGAGWECEHFRKTVGIVRIYLSQKGCGIDVGGAAGLVPVAYQHGAGCVVDEFQCHVGADSQHEEHHAATAGHLLKPI